jgi:hypothetical protein
MNIVITWVYPWLVSGSGVTENGFCLFKAAKSKNMTYRKIVALEILYRTIYNTSA